MTDIFFRINITVCTKNKKTKYVNISVLIINKYIKGYTHIPCFFNGQLSDDSGQFCSTYVNTYKMQDKEEDVQETLLLRCGCIDKDGKIKIHLSRTNNWRRMFSYLSKHIQSEPIFYHSNLHRQGIIIMIMISNLLFIPSNEG